MDKVTPQNAATRIVFAHHGPAPGRRQADTEEGRAAWAAERLGAQLTYVFLVSRLAHYLKRVQRERIGQWDSRTVLQKELDVWLRQYVSDIEDPHWETRARRPLRKAAITVEQIQGQVGVPADPAEVGV